MPGHQLDAQPRERLQAEDRKSQIIQTVVQLVDERGLDAVSTQLIADTIGRSQGVVFRHFPTKEALWQAVFDWLQESLRQVWVRALAKREGESAMFRLERIFSGHVALINEFPGIAKMVMSDQLRQQYPSLNENFRALHIRYEKHVKGLLEEAALNGEISRSTNVADAAVLYFCSIQGLGFQFAIAGLRRSQLLSDATRIFALFTRAIEARQDPTPRAGSSKARVK